LVSLIYPIAPAPENFRNIPLKGMKWFISMGEKPS
jgi:hypothetical protein